jgi:uncharacterized iron-regulated membrane protein
MKLFRSILFWTHLTTGVLASVVILVMSFTGVVLALKPQIQNWIERDVRYVTPQDPPRLGVHRLMTAVKDAKPDAAPQSIALARDPESAATVGLGREGNVYVNPYTGAILGTGSERTTRFFQSMTSWHRYMGGTGEYRAAGKSATGVSNLAFLVLGLTGLYLWWPKQLIARYVKPIVWFRRTATGRARDFNWHNTIGFWCLIPIVIMTASGAVISYSWATNLVYKLTGSPVPQRGPGGPGPGGPREGVAPGARAAAAAIPDTLDTMWARAEDQLPTWSLISLRLPEREGAPVSLSLTDGAHWNGFARSQLTLDAKTGEIVQWQPYQNSSLGQKARGWLRFAHTGELGGLTGQIIAGLGCLGGVFLVYTGFALALRRLWNWSLWARWRESPQTVTTSATTASARVGRQPVAD